MIKERYRIEILDKKTKEKTVFLVNNFSQNIKYDIQPIYVNGMTHTEWVNCGHESVELKLFNPKVHQTLKSKTKKKPKSRKSNGK